MGVREWVKRRQSLAAVGAVVMIAGAAVAIFVQARDPDAGSGMAFFTTDDGKTLFTDRITRLAPFDKDGKPACRAHVFECDGKRFVGYLQKYTPQGTTEMEKLQQTMGARSVNAAAPFGIDERQTLYKKPGGKEWKPATDPAGGAATLVRCPGGGGVPMRVAP